MTEYIFHDYFSQVTENSVKFREVRRIKNILACGIARDLIARP